MDKVNYLALPILLTFKKVANEFF